MQTTFISALLVEDNPGDARLIREMLGGVKSVRVEVSEAESIPEALRQIDRQEFDVVLLDLSLPGTRGIETFTALHSKTDHLPIIVLTGLDDEGVALNAVGSGSQDYLVKGQVDGDVIARAIRYAMERHRSEVELAVSRSSFSNIVEKNGDGILIADGSGKIRFVNPAWEKFSGEPADRLLGQHVTFPLVRDATTEIDIVRVDSSRGEGEVRVVETRWRGEDAFLLTLRDVTDRKLAEQALRTSEADAVATLTELEATQQHLVQAAKLSSRGQLVAGVAHELNNPLYAMLGLSHLILQEELDDGLRSDLQMIHTQTERCGRIVQNLLSFARRSGSERRYVSVNTVVEAAVELRANDLRLKGIDLEVSLDLDISTVFVDDNEIQQVVLNLLMNAEDAMLETNGAGKLSVKTSRRESVVEISVADDGPGIPEENIDSVFDPFFTTKEVGKGTGLGLSICYGIVRDHRGVIRVENGKSQGATFVVELPLANETPETSIAEEFKHAVG